DPAALRRDVWAQPLPLQLGLVLRVRRGGAGRLPRAAGRPRTLGGGRGRRMGRLADLLCRRLIHPLWARREDPRAAALARELTRRQFDPPAVVRARQSAALRRVLRHAAATVPYYRGLFARLRLRPEEIATVDDLAALPLLTKADIRGRGPELVPAPYRAAPPTRKK